MSGFDYLPTDPSDHDVFCFTTPYGVFSFIGAPQGWCNTPAYFSTRIMNEILLPSGLLGSASNDFKRSILQWIDDSLLFAKSFEEFYVAFEK